VGREGGRGRQVGGWVKERESRIDMGLVLSYVAVDKSEIIQNEEKERKSGVAREGGSVEGEGCQRGRVGQTWVSS